jgi:hypothetical protein
MAEQCTRCPSLEAENARLRAEIARLKQEIKLLRRRIEYLKNVMRTVLSILKGILYFIDCVLRQSGKIIHKLSGVPPMKWQRHKGRHEVAKKLEGSVWSAIRALESALE